MKHSLSKQEQAAMEKVITQLSQSRGVPEEEVRRDLTELIVESMKAIRDNPAARAFWQSCPCAGDIPTPEEFIFWTSCRVMGRLEDSSS